MSKQGVATRLSLDKARDIQAILNRCFQDVYVAEEWFFGGSLVRQRPFVGDIDIAFLGLPDTPERLDKYFMKMNAIQLAHGQTANRYLVEFPMGRTKTTIQIDTWTVYDRRAWGPTQMFVAGSYLLNTIQRAKAKKAGYKLGYFLKTIKDEEVVDVPTERAVYRLFDWKWLDYPEREVK